MTFDILHTRNTSLTITISHRIHSLFVTCKLCKNLLSRTIAQIDDEYTIIDPAFIIFSIITPLLIKKANS